MFGGTSLAGLAGLDTIENILKDIGLEPIFLPYLKQSLTKSSNSEAEVDPSVLSDQNNKILMENLKELHLRHKDAKWEQEAIQTMFNSGFLDKDDWMELQRDFYFKTRFAVIDEQKESLIEKIKSNIDKGSIIS